MEEKSTAQDTIQTPVEPIPQPTTEPEKKSLKSHKWLVLGLIVFILILISTATGYFYLNSNKQIACTQEAKLCPDGSSVGRTGPKCKFAKCSQSTSSSNLNQDESLDSGTTSDPTVIPKIVADTYTGYPYIKDDEIYFNNVKITNTNNSIYKYDYSEENQEYVYITANTDWYPYQVFIYKVNQAPKMIYEQIAVRDPKNDYINQITDVAFSKDGKKIALTTSTSLIVYNSEGEPENLLKLDTKDSFAVIFSYSNPIFSPDNSKILIRRHYYEGSNQSLVNLKTKTITDLKYLAYTEGKIALDWLPGNNMLIYEYTYFEFDKQQKNALSIYSSDNIKIKTFSINYGILFTIVDENKIYSLIRNTADSDNADLIEFNITNGSTKTIATFKHGEGIFPNRMLYSKKSNMIFVDVVSNPNIKNIYRLDLTNSNPKFILWKENANLVSSL